MPIDPRSPFHPYRVDPRAARQRAVARLEALGVALAEIPLDRSRPLLARFVDEFVEPSRVRQLHLELGRPLALERWLRPECIHDRGSLGCVRWLAGSVPGARCVRFERSVTLPALIIDLATLDDTWAASWPGLFVSFDAGRAVVVTLDYEEVRCDVRAARGTPYR
jgi:hypothetical protein